MSMAKKVGSKIVYCPQLRQQRHYNSKSYLGGTGKCHFIDVMMIDKCRSCGRSIARYYIYYARRESSLQVTTDRFVQKIIRLITI